MAVVADANSWIVEGPEISLLRQSRLGKMPKENADQVVREARRVLGRCGAPRQRAGSKVGLVVGYVQSGKTLNFTTVCALARDNNFPLVILIVGTKIPLFRQSNERIEQDLQLQTRNDRKWVYLPISLKEAKPTALISSTLDDWRSPVTPPSRRQTILITVMKHHGHLEYLTDTLRAVDLTGVPAIVIDDEGDQAGLNARVNQGNASTTYLRLLGLRNRLPVHTYLQYTATPQAPLLINIIDALSPTFVEVLTPGPGYTGGQTFFQAANLASYTRLIPTSDIAGKQNILSGPTRSLMQALATFFVGVAAGDVIDDAVGNRSMMIHPHQTRTPHQDYKRWACAIQDVWAEQLTSDNPDAETKEDVMRLLRDAYDDLSRTVSNLPSFNELMTRMPRVIRGTAIWEVNARTGTTPEVKWRTKYAHILVGGQAMDRGFTVEGLVVTYMPRGPGEGSADTVQQRARFFGYKAAYLGFCRVWLESDVRDAFVHYVDHEEHMRRQLIAHGSSGNSLRDWRRAFFLDPSLQPTRKSVLDVAYTRGTSGGKWILPEAPHILVEAIDENNSLIDSFLGELKLVADSGHERRTTATRHMYADGVSLKRAYADLLQAVRLADGKDSLFHTAMLLQISAWLDGHPEATCSIYEMRPHHPESKRTRNKADRLDNYLQGANPPKGPTQGSIYSGDRAVRHSSDLTIQIHTFKLAPNKDTGGPEFPRVRIAVVYLPPAMGKHWLVQ